jgi:hypothetical protein
MIPLSENLKREVAGILTGRDRTKKQEGDPDTTRTRLGSPRSRDTRLGRRPKADRSSSRGARLRRARSTELLERIEELARIATACENETRAVLNAVGGKVDPTMSLHSLFGHRSIASVKKGIDGGDIAGHEKYTEGVDFRKACGKTCVPCLLGNARNKPHSASRPNARHIPPEQQQQSFEEEYSASRKGESISKSALKFMHKHEGRQPSRDLPPLAYQSIDECTNMQPLQRDPNGSTDIRHVLISTCEVTGYRQIHGLADLTKESLL